jgi:hypothetical protein
MGTAQKARKTSAEVWQWYKMIITGYKDLALEEMMMMMIIIIIS